MSLDDFFSGNLSSERINIVITFDDGYKSWVTGAVPILKELKLPATFFVSSGFIGLSNDAEADFIQSKLFSRPGADRRVTGSLSFNDIRMIASEGFTLGGHTLNHCNLSNVTDRARAKYEIVEDKMRLERMTGKKVDYFAYPSGAFNNPKLDLPEILRESGYLGAVTTVSGFNTVGSSVYFLHRELTGSSMPGPVFRARAYGNYDAVSKLRRLVFGL